VVSDCARGGGVPLHPRGTASLVTHHVYELLLVVVLLLPTPLAAVVSLQPLLLFLVLDLVDQLLLQGILIGPHLGLEHLSPVNL
jgi:hypothetical protein